MAGQALSAPKADCPLPTLLPTSGRRQRAPDSCRSFSGDASVRRGPALQVHVIVIFFEVHEPEKSAPKSCPRTIFGQRFDAIIVPICPVELACVQFYAGSDQR